MDNIIIMAKNRWSFRRFIKKVNRIFDELGLSKAEDKTFIGRIEKGFDFLGFYFTKEGLTVSKKSVRKFAKNIVLRLTVHSGSDDGKITPVRRMQNSDCSNVYNAKQLRDNKHKGGLPTPEAVSVYVQRWLLWIKSIYGKENILEKAYSYMCFA